MAAIKVDRLPWANVRHFGASPSKTWSQNAAAFEAAEASLPNGGTLIVPKGTYSVSYRCRTQRVTIRGEGWGTVLKTPDGATTPTSQGDTAGQLAANDCPVRLLADHCTVEDLRIDGNAAGNGIATRTSDVQNRTFDGVGIYANYCTVRGCYIHDTIGHKVIVWNDSWHDATAPAANAARTGCVIENNLISGTSWRAGLDIASTQGVGASFDQKMNYGHRITGNVVIGSTTLPDGSAAPSGGITVHTGWDIIVSDNIVYDGYISIHTASRRVTASNNWLKGGSGITVSSAASGAVHSSEVAILGNTIRDSAAASNGIQLDVADDCLVAANTILNAAQFGIIYKDCTRCTIRGNVLKGCVGRGIEQSSSGTTSTYMAIDGNTVLDTTGTYGIYFRDLRDSTICNNRVRNCQIGIGGSNASANRLDVNGNTVWGTSSNGMEVGAQNSNVNGNRIRSAGANGLVIQRATTHARWNHIDDPAARGISVSAGATGCVLVGNRINDAASNLAIEPVADTVCEDNWGYNYAAAMPTGGTFPAGCFVKNTASGAILGTAGSRYTLAGWRRITSLTPAAHVAGTDWVEVRELTGT